MDMNSVEIKERLDKALETVEKRQATIERHKAQAEKKLQLIKEKGWEQGLEDFEYRRADMDRYWLITEYLHKLEDIESATEKLDDAKQIAKNWEGKYNAKLADEALIATEIPEAFKEAKEALVEAWVEYDIRSREAMKKARAEMDFKEFRKLYTYSAQESLSKTDEEFRKIEERDATAWLLDLYNRVKKITGEVTDASHITWGGKCLDGYVEGKQGKALVETIGAGGYNIQKWHLRTLVKAYK